MSHPFDTAAETVTAARSARQASLQAEFRAGGTDTTARQALNRAGATFVDLATLPQLRGLQPPQSDKPAQIGAMTTLAELANHTEVQRAYPGLAAATAAIGTPEVRARATVGGNLLQRNRCTYYRNPLFACHQTGAEHCPARTADLNPEVLVDLGPCLAVHPSTLAVALLAYDATIVVDPAGQRSVAELLGDGSDPTSDHQLDADELVTAVHIPAPEPEERAAYHRLTRRSAAEWPQVETVVRLGITEGSAHVRWARVTVGGVARVPLRLHAVEEALTGQPATDETWHVAAQRATDATDRDSSRGALLRASVLEAVERATAAGAHG